MKKDRSLSLRETDTKEAFWEWLILALSLSFVTNSLWLILAKYSKWYFISFRFSDDSKISSKRKFFLHGFDEGFIWGVLKCCSSGVISTFILTIINYHSNFISITGQVIKVSVRHFTNFSEVNPDARDLNKPPLYKSRNTSCN